MKKLTFPNGKSFAFSIFDDTDVATLGSIKPIYDLLSHLGIQTTKTVWSLNYTEASDYRGSDSLQNEDYAEYMRELQRRGFEIGFHGARMESTERPGIEQSLDVFLKTIGHPPQIYAAHSMNRDNIFWGPDRFTCTLWRRLYMLISGESADHFQGHKQGSPFFWGDLAKQHIKYARSFTFTNINLASLHQPLVYRSKVFPWINNWFLTSDADNVEEFNQLLSHENQERLEREGGICIISTHLGKGFVSQKGVHPKTELILRELSERNGWFVPVSELLDFYTSLNDNHELNNVQLFALETKWFLNALLRKFRKKRYNATETEFLLNNQENQMDSRNPIN